MNAGAFQKEQNHYSMISEKGALKRMGDEDMSTSIAVRASGETRL